MDLALSHYQLLMKAMVAVLRPFCIHMRLPSSTCSRAREKALPKELQSKCKTPLPLRDASHLFGFEYLAEADLAKVETANNLYRFSLEILFLAFQMGIKIAIQNPARSWLWAILAELVRSHHDADFRRWYASLEQVAFSACMHGSRRNQRTRLLSSPGLFSSLAVDCDNRHEHLPWTVAQPGCCLPFAAARKAEYPPLLCARMAHCLQAAAHADGYVLDSHVSSAQRDKHVQGRQTVKSRPLVPEFKDFLHVPTEVTQPGHRLLATPHARETQPEWPCDSDGDGQPGWRPSKGSVRCTSMEFSGLPRSFLRRPSKCCIPEIRRVLSWIVQSRLSSTISQCQLCSWRS